MRKQDRAQGWLLSITRLLMLGRPSLSVATGGAVAAFFSVSILLGAALATPSPLQQEVALLGSTDAVVSIPVNGAGNPPGSRISLPHWGEVTQGLNYTRYDVLNASVVVRGDDAEYHETSYLEAAWSSPPLDGNYVLASGRPIAAAGECLRTERVAADAALPFGSRTKIVGTVRSPSRPDFRVLICAPGTWAQWTIPAEYAPMARLGASVTTYLSGPDTLAAVSAIRAWKQLDSNAEVMSRDDLESLFGRLTPQRFLATWIPLLGLPFGLCIILGGSFGSWAAGITHQLHTLGVPRNRLLSASAMTIAVTTVASSVVGAVIAVPSVAVVRPLVSLWNGGAELGDAAVPLPLLIMVVVASLLGGMAGCAVGMVVGLRRRHQSVRQATAWRPRERRILTGSAVSLAGLAAVLVAVSDGRMWYMASGSLLGSLAFSCAAALALDAVAGLLQKANSPMRVLAGRLLHDDSRRWGVGVLTMTTFVGVLVMTSIYVTASAAAFLPLMASRVPPGVAALQVQDPAGIRVPAAAVAEFEAHVGANNPVLVKEEYYANGPIWGFASIQDLERVTGQLPADVVDRLEHGAVISHKALKAGPVTLTTFGTGPPITVDVIPFTADSVRRYAHPAGFMLANAIPAPDGVIPVERLVYLGLDQKAEREAQQFFLGRGLMGVEVLSYSGEAEASWPLWTSMSLAGFAVLVLVITAMVARREVAALRPLLGAFVALGLRKSWLRAVIVPLVLVFAGTCAVFALLGGLYALALLAANYPKGVFDAAGVPWWLLGIFLASILISAASAGLLVTRGQISPALTLRGEGGPNS